MPRRITAAPPALHYEFSLDAARANLAARVCVEGPVAGFRPMHRESTRRVHSVVDDASGEALPLQAGRYSTRALGERPCIRYQIDLTPSFGWAGVLRIEDDLVLATGAFLLAPEPRDAHTRITAEVALPAGARMAPIWPVGPDGRYQLDERAFRFVGYTAIGSMEVETLGVPGGCLDIAVVGPRSGHSQAERMEIFTRVARAASRITGRFPAQRATVVMTLLEGEGTVGFGIAGRGPIPSVALFVSRDASADEIASHYTPVHEFSHFAGPYVPADEAWLGEGLATYYQEVLRVREGLIDEPRAWRQFLNGLASARRAWGDETLREAAARMRHDGVYGRVYWSGAAIALLADVALRREGSSLDEAMARVGELRDEILAAESVCLALDGGEPGTVTRIAGQHLDAREPPDLAETYAWLGVVVQDGALTALDDQAPGAAIRHAIMNESPELASIPTDCGPTRAAL